jgi:hypothetical protein
VAIDRSAASPPATGGPQKPAATADGGGACTGPRADGRVDNAIDPGRRSSRTRSVQALRHPATSLSENGCLSPPEELKTRSCMKRVMTMGRRAALMVLAMSAIIASGSLSVAQPEEPDVPARDRNSARSSPPDMTPYTRPVIPEDLMKTPLPERRDDKSPPALNTHHPNSQSSSHQDGSLPPGK